MQFRLSFDELERLIVSKTGKKVPMSYGGIHTLRVSYDVNVLFKSTTVGLDINVDRVDNTDIYLSHNGGTGIDFALRTALKSARNRPGMDMIEMVDGGRMILHLGRNPQAKQIFDHVTLRDICFDENSAIIDFIPNMH